MLITNCMLAAWFEVTSSHCTVSLTEWAFHWRDKCSHRVNHVVHTPLRCGQKRCSQQHPKHRVANATDSHLHNKCDRDLQADAARLDHSIVTTCDHLL